MALIKGKEIAKILSQEQLKDFGISPESDFELTKIRQGVIVISEKEFSFPPAKSPETTKQGPDKIALEEKILSLLEEKKLSERVEGKFEKLLSQKEAEQFREMLKEGKVFAFKLSDKYKKPVYKIAPPKKKESEKAFSENKPAADYCLEKDGLLVCSDRKKAELLSYELKDSIKSGQISGIKSFDGNYYIIETSLLQRYSQPVLEIIKANKTIPIEEIAKKASVSAILARITCEFLKEDGEIIEKKKGQYSYVK
ncbi:MAG: hypothetical protein PHD95_04265 [Candidatus ainarchaeum sp.]|nr:hypothetical protein [Candidatus ainarchaeum sp.]